MSAQSWQTGKPKECSRRCHRRAARFSKSLVGVKTGVFELATGERTIVTNEKGHHSEAILEIGNPISSYPGSSFSSANTKQYPELMLTVIHVQERGAPHGRKRVDWKLITDLPVPSREEAVEKNKVHALEDRDLSQNSEVWLQSRGIAAANRRTAQRLTNLIAVF